MTFEETKELLAELVLIYPKKFEFTGTEMIKMWTNRLADLSKERAWELIDEWLEGSESKFPPNIDYFIKNGKIVTNIKRAFLTDEPIVFHVERGFLVDQESRDYGRPGGVGRYRSGSAPFEIFYERNERIQWMDEKGFIHNWRGVFGLTPKCEFYRVKVQKETA